MAASPDAYAYEADLHCPDCARERFGADAEGFIGIGPDGDPCTDSEGNPVGAIAPWDWDRDEYSIEHGEHCGTCGREILAPENHATRAAAAGLAIDSTPYDRVEMRVPYGSSDPYPVILRMRRPRPDADRPGGFVWDLELWDPYRSGPVVALWDDFRPSPGYYPTECPIDAARVMADAAALAEHALRYDRAGNPRPVTRAEESLADRLYEIASDIQG
jgi:hypothetical protein